MSPRAPGSVGSRLAPPRPRWLLPEAPGDGTLARLEEALRLPRPVCSVLAARGFTDPDDAKRFLRPSFDDLHDPTLLADGTRAAERVASAIRSGETVLVHGDYDVDGICAAALYARWLSRLGGRVVPFVPHRTRDGYDFGPAGLAAAEAAGARLIVTADCGTVAHDTVSRAAERGIDVIVTDHHTVAGAPPPALAVVNPQRPDCSYPDKRLCGTGLAYKVCQLVADAVGANRAELDAFLDLVALATVADLVPLAGENRVLVRHGLRRLSETTLAGLVALRDVSGVAAAEVTAGKVGFVLAPRINAAGRIGESADALRLLMTDDAGEARALAARLDATNRERQDEDRRILDEALATLEERYDPHADFGVVLASEGWHPGVIGIVASRVVERIHRPVVLVALDGDRGRGSARSVPGFDLYAALAECSAHMVRFGGHRQAAGMDVERSAVPALREAFNAVARRAFEAEPLFPTLRADTELDPAEADLQLVHWLGYLGPHGIGNPGPTFLARAVTLDRPRVVGDGHLKARLQSGDGRLDAIGFGLARAHPAEAIGTAPYDVVFRLDRNEYRGTTRAQARILDLRASASGNEP